MDSRGEKEFVKFPSVAAKLYDYMTSGRSVTRQFNEIADYIVSRIEQGRLLDVGTGPGKLLLAIHQLNPNIELYGLDLSDSMIKIAYKNLEGIPVHLEKGNIRRTEFKDEFFDLVTRTGSFYLWDSPEKCLDEIYRILNPDSTAYLFETFQDYPEDLFKKALKINLKKENILRRIFSPMFLDKQLKMTYKISEIDDIICKTRFRDTYYINKMKLGGLPIWLCIELHKTS